MPQHCTGPVALTQSQARLIWLHAQRLDTPTPFGNGAEATVSAVEHLGYVQIDTINVIERCHHHILWTRIPEYRRDHLRQPQTVDKAVFEYWTHALSYVPTKDFRFFLADMKQHRTSPRRWFHSVTKDDLRKVLTRIEEGGALSIRDIDDDTLVEKDHAWGSRKPSKRALQFAFYTGALTVSERSGMLKTYELMQRHFAWDEPLKAASQAQTTEYLLDRALRSQGLVSLAACAARAAMDLGRPWQPQVAQGSHRREIASIRTVSVWRMRLACFNTRVILLLCHAVRFQPVAQRVVDPSLPARAAAFELIQQIGR